MFLFIAVVVLLPSCATLLSGTSDRFYFHTTPVTGDVYVDGSHVGKTNQKVKVKRAYRNYRMVELKSEGYSPIVIEVDQKVDPVYWLNLWLSGASCLIDIVTGAVMEPKQTDFSRNFVEK